MKAMLDTNICIYIIKQQPPRVIEKLLATRANDMAISVITVAELRYGASKSARSKQNHEALDQFLLPFTISPFEKPAASAYGELRAALEKKGRPIGPLDMLIAAQALSLGVRLITNNTKEFRQVPGLRVENWV
ncbi:MAG: type II toxin-antitoxin system tRNA(fMet)-specific endonuclease VapC [Vicinamibacteria bacterium]